MKKPRIFIVEDVELQMLHLRTELEGLGYEVVGSAASGEDAVEKISATRPDLLLLDIHLAGEMNGTDVARRVNERSDIPFIYLTAYSDEETFAKTIGTKPSGYILKPYTLTALDFQIRLALSNAEARRMSEERGRKLQALIEQSGDAIILIDSFGRIVEWNPRAEEIFGIPRDDSLGQEIWEVQFRLLRRDERTRETHDRMKREISAAFESRTFPETSALTESAIVLPDGRRRHVQVSYFRIEEEDDFLVCGIVRDITKQKEYEYEQDTLYLFLTACNALEDSRTLIREYCRLIRERLSFPVVAGFLVDERDHLDFVEAEGSLTRELLERPEVVNFFEELCRLDRKGELDRYPGLAPLGRGFYVLENFPESVGLERGESEDCPKVLNLAPIRSGPEHLGLILFCTDDAVSDESRKISLLELAIEQLALTLKRFSAEKAMKVQNELLTVRNLISSKVNISLDLDEILSLALDVMSEVLSADGGMVHFYDKTSKRFVLRRSSRLEGKAKAAFNDIAMADSILGSSATLGSTIIVDDLSLDSGKIPEAALDGGWRSLICTPLKREEEFYGILTLFSVQKRRFDKTTSDLMNSVVNPIAMAVENSILYQRLARSNEDLERRVQERTNNLEVLNKIAHDLNYVMDYHQLFSLLFSHLWSVTRFDIAVGLLWEDGVSKVYVSRSCAMNAAVEDLLRTKIEGALWKFSGTLPPASSNIIVMAEGVPFDSSRELKTLTSFYEAPFYHEDELIAYLVLGAEGKDAFTENQIQLLDIVANQSSVLLKRLRDLLSSEKTRLEQLVESLPQALLLLDKDWRIVIKNPVAEDLLALVFGDSIPEVLSDIGGLKLEDIAARGEDNQAGSSVVEIGENRILSVTSVPVRKGPDSGGMILSIQDITAERKQEIQIKLRERLAAVGQLAAGIAHDFNNILTGIIGYSEYLQLRKDMSDPAKSYLRKIIEQSKRAGSLIQQILDFSRKSVAEFHAIDLVPFCKEMVKLFVRLIPENIRISFETREKSCVVRGDPTQIQQILTNLVVNSRDAMPEGGTITLALKEFRPERGEYPPIGGLGEGAWVRITVSDTGVGIPKDVLPRVFEPFFTTKEVGKGSGLGLAQVYGLVQQHNGYIGIESAMGRGTSVDIYLPADERLETEAEEASEVFLPIRSEGIILFVEDEDGVREITTNLLEEVGFTVLAADNGRKGLDLYRTHRGKIDLVVSDVIMPGMGGRELFREIRKLDPEIPFIFITGHPFGKEDGADEILMATVLLRKPIEFATLIRTINEILSVGKRQDHDE